jgi:hypothetical protein
MELIGPNNLCQTDRNTTQRQFEGILDHNLFSKININYIQILG